ncbi:MAG: hypothetical protein KDL87_01935, partial [Verrucomicrobiae bacterium]|nr:hypothetical protein [Verrucomicrobiae bacterium]
MARGSRATALWLAMLGGFGILLTVAWWRSSRSEGACDPVSDGSVAKTGIFDQPILSAAERDDAALTVFTDFRDWIEANQGSTEGLKEGLRLARSRREAMYDLIATDPRAALEQALSPAERASLPEPVAALVERRVGGRGDFFVIGATPAPGGPKPAEAIFRRLEVGGETFRAYVFGRRHGNDTKLGIPVDGVAVDDRVALAEAPLRPLLAGESESEFPPATPVALGPHVVVAPEGPGPVFVSGGELLRFCCDEHAQAWAAAQVAAESTAGPNLPIGALDDTGSGTTTGGSDIGLSSWTEGLKDILVIRADFPDLTGEPVTPTGATMNAAFLTNKISNEVGPFYDEASYGKTALSLSAANVTPVLRMPTAAQTYAANDSLTQLRIDALAAAETAGYDTGSYDRIYLVFTHIGPSRYSNSQFTWAGVGLIGGSFMWINGYFDLRVAGHEMGHTYGLRHANLWQIPGGSSNPVDLSGSSTEYGDWFDMMGDGPSSASTQPDYFNPWFMNRLDWMANQSIQTVTTGGTYRLFRYDHRNANQSNTLAL